jgi:hypothetical protein
MDYKVRQQLFGYHTSPDINDFDRRLMPITLRFGDRHSMADAIEAYVRRTPWLLDRMEQHRAEVPAETRLRWLQKQLSRHVDSINGLFAPMQAGLAALPADYQLILVLGLFQRQFGKGGVRLFFFNSAGNLAPEVLAAFEALNLTKHATVMRNALAMFAEPYERNWPRRFSATPPRSRQSETSLISMLLCSSLPGRATLSPGEGKARRVGRREAP